MATNEFYLPTEEELTVPELPISSVMLRAAAFHLGKHCENQSNEFMLCKEELKDPRKCLNEGKILTSCAFEFFKMLKKSCKDEYHRYANCLNTTSGDHSFEYCRKTQAVYDSCVLDKMNIERPYYGYFSEVKIHDSERPEPPKPKKRLYLDTPDKLPADAPKPPAKYGSRFPWMND